MLGALPRGLGRDEWLQALPRALVAGFVKTDKEFQSRGVWTLAFILFPFVDRKSNIVEKMMEIQNGRIRSSVFILN